MLRQLIEEAIEQGHVESVERESVDDITGTSTKYTVKYAVLKDGRRIQIN